MGCLQHCLGEELTGVCVAPAIYTQGTQQQTSEVATSTHCNLCSLFTQGPKLHPPPTEQGTPYYNTHTSCRLQHCTAHYHITPHCLECRQSATLPHPDTLWPPHCRHCWTSTKGPGQGAREGDCHRGTWTGPSQQYEPLHRQRVNGSQSTSIATAI